MPKFEPGDVVTLTGLDHLCREYKQQCGIGPFILDRKAGLPQTRSWHLLNMDGTDQPCPRLSNTGGYWHVPEEFLHRDEFLTAVHKAKHAKV